MYSQNQDNLELIPAAAINTRSSLKSPARLQPTPPPSSSPKAPSQVDRDSMKAYIDQVRTLVLGMEQRMQSREENLLRALEAAEEESAKYEDARRQVTAL